MAGGGRREQRHSQQEWTHTDAIKGRAAVVQLLMEAGAKTLEDATKKDGNTPIQSVVTMR